MRLFLDICQGFGLSAAAGIRPFLPALAAGGLAAADLGVDFERTSYDFLEKPAWLLAVAILLVISLLLRAYFETPVAQAALAGVAIGVGALLAAGSLADHGYASWPGLIYGGVGAALGQSGVRDIFVRTAARLDAAARAALPLYFEGAALVLAGLSVLAPPVSILAAALLVRLILGGRRREGEKFAGLRILR